FGRQFALGIPAIVFGIAALFRGRIGSLDLGGTARPEAKTSNVGSRFVEVTLDHETGRLTGQVIEGVHAGRALDDLDRAELGSLLREASVDADSAALVESYLDSRFPGWREDSEDDARAGPGGAPDAGAMTDEQAYEILGLAPGAGEAEIRAA